MNVPAIAEAEIRGVQLTRLGKRLYRDALVSRKDPRGRDYYWVGGEPPSGVIEDGTDIGAVANGVYLGDAIEHGHDRLSSAAPSGELA